MIENKILCFLVGGLSLIASLTGVLNPSIYSKVISEEVMAGIVSQDGIIVIVAIVMLTYAFTIKSNDSKKQTVMLGIMVYLFYAYGIYVMERVYNLLYFIYMAVFSLSFYSVIHSLINIKNQARKKIKLSKFIQIVYVGFLLLIPTMFYLLWINKLIPLIQSGQKVEFFYSIYILDMCFIMPLYIIIAIMMIKKQDLALLLAAIMFTFGFILLLSVGLGELLKPFYHMPLDKSGIWLYFSLSLMFLILYLSIEMNTKNKKPS